MVHEYPLPNLTKFSHDAVGYVPWRTVASYERELIERRDSESRLRRALARDEALLRQKDDLLKHREVLSREADHSLQSRSEGDSRAAAHLSSAANRVATIARIHSRLHSLDGQETVAFKRFIDELCHDYSDMLTGQDRRNQGIVVEGIEVRLPAATAIPLSLVTTELITNAVKHGRGAITVRLEAPAGGGHVLSVCNDGEALPRDFDPAASEGLGMKIMLALVTQIGGTLQVGPCGQCQGTRFAVAFN